MARTITRLTVMVKDGAIFETGDLQAATFTVENFKIENGILSFKKTFTALEEEPETGKNKKVMKTERREFIIEEELLLLEVAGVRVFPIYEDEEEDDVDF